MEKAGLFAETIASVKHYNGMRDTGEDIDSNKDSDFLFWFRDSAVLL